MTSVAVDVVFADDLVRIIKLSYWHFSATAQQQRQKQSTPISCVQRPERRHNELTVVAASKISRPLLLSSAVVPPPPPGRRPNEKLLADYTIRAICLSTRQQLAARATADLDVVSNWIEAKL